MGRQDRSTALRGMAGCNDAETSSQLGATGQERAQEAGGPQAVTPFPE